MDYKWERALASCVMFAKLNICLGTPGSGQRLLGSGPRLQGRWLLSQTGPMTHWLQHGVRGELQGAFSPRSCSPGSPCCFTQVPVWGRNKRKWDTITIWFLVSSNLRNLNETVSDMQSNQGLGANAAPVSSSTFPHFVFCAFLSPHFSEGSSPGGEQRCC